MNFTMHRFISFTVNGLRLSVMMTAAKENVCGHRSKFYGFKHHSNALKYLDTAIAWHEVLEELCPDLYPYLLPSSLTVTMVYITYFFFPASEWFATVRLKQRVGDPVSDVTICKSLWEVLL